MILTVLIVLKYLPCLTIMIIIYHDFLHPPRRGSHVMSDTHTTIQYTPLSTYTWVLIFSNCAVFKVYPNRIMKLHSTPLQVITIRAREGGPKKHTVKQNGRVKLNQLLYAPGLSTLSYLSLIFAQPPLSFHCCTRLHSHLPSSLTSVYLVPYLV